MRKYILLFCSIAILGGCAEQKPNDCENTRLLEPIVVVPSFSRNYLLSCLSDMQTLERQYFDAQFELAAAEILYATDQEKLRFICLSLNEKADYKQFKQGSEVLEEFIEDHPESGPDMHGFRILVDRLNEEIINRWSAWKSLLNDKKELKAEVESLKVTVVEQQQQIEQLKNIENIIKSRGPNQP